MVHLCHRSKLYDVTYTSADVPGEKQLGSRLAGVTHSSRRDPPMPPKASAERVLIMLSLRSLRRRSRRSHAKTADRGRPIFLRTSILCYTKRCCCCYCPTETQYKGTHLVGMRMQGSARVSAIARLHASEKGEGVDNITRELSFFRNTLHIEGHGATGNAKCREHGRRTRCINAAMEVYQTQQISYIST